MLTPDLIARLKTVYGCIAVVGMRALQTQFSAGTGHMQRSAAT